MGRWLHVEDERSRSGGNGEVFKVTDTTGAYAGFGAQKVLRPERFDRYERFRREVRVAGALDHPNIVKILDAFLPDELRVEAPPFFVMPWYGGGTLHDLVVAKKYFGDVGRTMEVMLPILKAVAALHETKRFHRDIKPRNIVFDDDARPILCDFGLCFDVDDEHLTLSKEVVGSLRYRAPEYLAGRVDVEDHGPSDVFSLGKTIWAMLVAAEPPEGPIMAYPDHNLVVRVGATMQDVQQLIQGMTGQDRKQRPTVPEVLNDIEALLAPPAAGQVSAAASTRKILKRFAETDPNVADARREAEAAANDLKDVTTVMQALRKQLEEDEDVRALMAEYPVPMPGAKSPPEFCVRIFGPDEIELNDRKQLATDLGFEVPRARAVYVDFLPLGSTAMRLPMINATWSIAHRGRKLRVITYVYSRGPDNAVRGLSGHAFDTFLDSASLPKSLAGLVTKRLGEFFKAITESIAAAPTT